MDIARRRLLMSSFFTSHFNYCPLIWMFHSRVLNNKINRLHERCLLIVYNDNIPSFKDLLDKDKSVSIQTLALEMFKVAKNLSVSIVSEIFEKRNDICNLRDPSEFVLPKVHSVFHGIESS